MQPAKLLTVPELAFRLNVHPKTLYSWTELGKIPHYKINGSVRFDFHDIQRWLDACKRHPTCGRIDAAQAVAVPRKGR